MSIVKKPTNKKLTIDLTGSEGNAFCLLAYAKNLCRQLGKNFAAISEKMKSGDYENLVKVFDEEFGKFVILER